ncbi:hypothetical protein [Burkholderia sp. 22PA0106]|uniref:hypothetical protein n=1 Tax=Burkholderia sp. 22PA0106 TaxID=3237371 RepID=UPI0039C37DD7
MYNTLYVPLNIGTWQCMLVPRRQYDANNMEIRWMRERRQRDSRRSWARNDRSLISRDRAVGWSGSEAEEQRQRDEDRRAFDLYFRPNWDLHSITGAAALGEVQTFLSELLHVAHMNLPTDNTGAERALRRAVEDGSLVPFVNRERIISASTYRPTPAPLSWPPIGTSGGQMQPTYYGLKAAMAGGEAGAGSSGCIALAPELGSVLDTGTGGATNAAGGFDWLGVAKTIAGAALGGVDSAATDAMTMPLGDAQPFEYVPDFPDGVPFDIAKTPNTGEPGTWYTNPGSGQMRLFGNDGAPVVDLDFDHFHKGIKPHAHNWSGGARDGGSDVVPFSPWNP